ncbi:MAG: MXAN_6640 family putative metalloprotease [Myxococcota bacterium]
MGVSRIAGVFGLASVVLVAADARAEPRPTEGGLWGFDPADVVTSWEEPTGLVRVHYSIEGPNVTLLTDADADAVPDFPQLVALTTADALDYFTLVQGLREPVAETEVGVELGGSAALDVYLVDFGGAADGRFGVDACTAESGYCSGFLTIENDFAGYGYPSLEDAVRVVGSHELFHAIQAAYAELPIWVSEGTATWGTRRYDDSLLDFINACGGYLASPGRPIYEPPLGPVPVFAYGTALWWEFISTRAGDSVIEELLLALDDADGAEPAQVVMEQAIANAGDTLADAWPVFARYNLAAGFRAGAAQSHEYAGQLDPIDADAEGPTLDLNARLYPLAATYWRIDHAGGALVFGADAELPDALFSLHPVGGFESDGAVGDAIAEWDAAQAGSQVVYEPDLPAGGYWIVATRPVIADGSAQGRVCIGSADHVSGCGIEPIPDNGGDDDGSSSGSVDETGGSDETGAQDDDSTGGSTSDATGNSSDGGAIDDGGSGCSCTAQDDRRPLAGLWMMLALVLLRRRRNEP